MTLLRALLTASCLALALPAAAQTVDAPAGKVKGTAEAGINSFKGIPYALPPVAGRRWQPPVPLPKWSGVRQAATFGPACIQPTSKGQSVYSPLRPLPTSEDCLTLNIWAPANAKNAPVFFWIHGGALVSGSSSELTYDGQKMAERGVIVVSINYRLGVLGWLAHPALSQESAQHISGNYGLLDQVTALRWVHSNIAAFGGNPGNVTIAGESAGGLSTLYLLTSPAARGLFQKAIAESSYMIAMPDLKKSVLGFPSGEAMGQLVQAGLQQTDLAGMRGIDAQSLTDNAAKLGFQPWGLVDNYVLPQQMVDAFDQGKQAPVPVMAGFNQGEIRSLMVLAPKPTATPEEYEAKIRENYGELADAFLKLYPTADYKESILKTTRDSLYGWTAERIARKQAAIGQPAYIYEWDHGYPSMDSANLHAFHASELPFVFGTVDTLGPLWPKIPDTAEEHALSDAMIGYWTSFAKTGVPKADNAPDWPIFGKDRAFMHFTATPTPETQLMPGMYELNEQVMCRRRATGKIAWHWNVGLMSPPLPPKAEGC
jgi:para-nitrobenzyl esterase